MKQVWQTADGAIFDSYNTAAEWEDTLEEKAAFANFLGRQCMCLDRSNINEVVETIFAHYNVEPKK